jgi:hypothetical protein
LRKGKGKYVKVKKLKTNIYVSPNLFVQGLENYCNRSNSKDG